MLSKLKEAPKLVKISQYIVFISVILYFMESLFVRGLFTNTYLFVSAAIVGCISAIMALCKKTYMFAIIDAALVAVCILLFTFLTDLI